MKTQLFNQLIFFLMVIILLSSCTNSKNEHVILNNKEVIKEKITGEAFLQSIRDTIKKEKISENFLQSNSWFYQPFEDCISYYLFEKNGKGTSFDCEMEDTLCFTYYIKNDEIHISEFDFENHISKRKIKTREDVYVFSSNKLTLIDSRFLSESKSWVPEIENIICYQMKSR